MREQKAIRLGMDSVGDLFCKLEHDSKIIERDGPDSWNVFNLACTAHHLSNDWIPQIGTEAMKERLSRVKNSTVKHVIQVCADITNGIKHYELTHKKSLQSRSLDRVTKTNPTSFNNVFGGSAPSIVFSGYWADLHEFNHMVFQTFEWVIGRVEENPIPIIEMALELWRIPKEDREGG